MKFASKLVIALSAAASVVGFASTASAEGQWGRHDVRHHEVYRGEHRQSDRYGHERRQSDFRGRSDFREDGRR